MSLSVQKVCKYHIQGSCVGDTWQKTPYFSSSEQQDSCFALLFTVLFYIFILQS